MNVYLYVLDTLSDWEIGYLTAALNCRQYFRKDAPILKIVKVADTKDTICTMGGMSISPDITVDDLSKKLLASETSEEDMLVLPGGNTWFDGKKSEILELSKKWLSSGKNLAAICGATLALASKNLLNDRKHTSNDKDFLIKVCPTYTGQELYQNSPCVVDGNLITAPGTAPVDFSYQVMKKLSVFADDTLDAWYNLYKTQEPKYFYELIKSVG